MIDKKVFYQDGEMYAQFFLFNNEMNNAGDPIKFKVYPENSKKIAETFIGRPYLLPMKDEKGNWINKHHRDNDLNVLLNKQKKFAAGDIVAVHQNRRTGNWNAVVKVFPEHYDTFRKQNIPPATSPMLAHSDSHLDEEGRLHIKDGMGVHLQGVVKGGYPPELSEVKSICEAGLNECMAELQTVAAAGQLLDYQESESFSITESEENHSMSQQTAPPGQAPGAPQAGADEGRIAALEKAVAEISQNLQMILQKLGGAPQGNAPPAAPPVGAAGEQAITEVPEEVKQMQAELTEVKSQYEQTKQELESEKLKMFLDDRNRVATEIVETKLKLHRISPEMKEAEIKKLVELKSGENYMDLSLLHAELKDTLSKFVGAAGEGHQVYTIPELGGDETSAEIDYHSVMESVQ
jgi:hypothetical protein